VRLTFTLNVLFDFAAIVPDVDPNVSHPAPSLAVQLIDALPLLLSVTDVVVAVFPKSTLSGETENVEGTVIDTGI
jgi:hypothetical protein